MADLDITHLIYSVILLALVGGWFIAEYGRNFRRFLRMATAWIVIFFGVMAAYGVWEDIRPASYPRQAVLAEGAAVETTRDASGHFRLTLELDGVPVEFMVDTGATDIVLTMEDAERVGIDPTTLPFIGRARTANGEVATAYTTVDRVSLGPITHTNVPVAVNEGEMPGSLLGMSYLNRFGRIEIENGRLRLEP